MKRNRTPLFPSIRLDGFCRPANPASQLPVAGNIMPVVTGTVFLYNHSLNTISRFHSSSVSFTGYNQLIKNRDAASIVFQQTHSKNKITYTELN
ncbi:hypothetical protein A3860_03960 [Niastella vici]|uniref:Uncharacterized protein n=1 Tax=Niastella vici TaxID=1703345 RepID=A0A1V9FRC9_9BACT|nr:hypothetical protein [Niastella vici]OQP60892.1 hypothetical protein A3860_03960 [Niastella vici]